MTRHSALLFLLTPLVVCRAGSLPVVDLSQDTARHVIIAQGTEKFYQGHPTTLLMPDGKTMFCVWTHGHGGTVGPLKRSEDGGKTWSDELQVPENWWQVKNCPALYRLTDPQGVSRLFVFAGQGPEGTMHQSVSTDEGKSGSIEISNAGADGYVAVDGLQIVPEAEAIAERNTRADAGFPLKTSAEAKAVVIPPPMLLKSAAKPQDVDGKSYDLVVIGGTPGGIACAVREGREAASIGAAGR
ncbi:MAG: hypothetical protein LDL31_00870 [Prosthecobacter sp.]|nr:hypothetical protein [Prosthecobacter sp.]